MFNQKAIEFNQGVAGFLRKEINLAPKVIMGAIEQKPFVPLDKAAVVLPKNTPDFSRHTAEMDEPLMPFYKPELPEFMLDKARTTINADIMTNIILGDKILRSSEVNLEHYIRLRALTLSIGEHAGNI